MGSGICWSVGETPPVYRKVRSIICTHTVRAEGWEVSMARRGQPTDRACVRPKYPSRAIRRTRREPQAMKLQPPAGCGSPFELDSPALHACNAREEKGQWAVGTCACYERAASASPAVRGRLVSLLEIISGWLGACVGRARVPASNLLSLLIRGLR